MTDNLVLLDSVRTIGHKTTSKLNRTAPTHTDNSQLELFSNRLSLSKHFVFMDFSWLDEVVLTHLVVRNHISVLIDLRKKPIFEKPKFNHKKTIGFLEQSKVEYFEYAFLKMDFFQSSSKFVKARKIRNRISHGMERGMALCLYDENEVESEYISDFRYLLNNINHSWIELIPSALKR